jgi:choline-sulfatase
MNSVAQNKNIVLITVDCFRYDKCGFNGHYNETTPVLNNLAQGSHVFNYAYATGPYTTESVPGIIAGQHSHNGVYFGHDSAWKAIPPNSTTLATHLNNAGYDTKAVLTNPHLTSVRNFDAGFDYFQNLRTRGDDKAERESNDVSNPSIIDRLRDRFSRSNRKYSFLTIPFVAYRYRQYRDSWPTIHGEDLVNEFISQLDSISSPFFMWTHFMDLHAPISPKVTSEEIEELADGMGTFEHLYHIGNFSRDVSSSAYEHIYDRAVRYVDHQIGKIIQELKLKNLWDESILVITGDHGEVINDRMDIHGHPRHHHYDELLRVPLIIRVPETDGQRIDQPVSLAWIPRVITNLVELTCGDFPADYERISVLGESNSSTPPVISDSLDRHGHTISIRNETYKLISHESDDNTLKTQYPYFNDDIAFRYRTDPTEREPQSSDLPQQLCEIVQDIATDKQRIPNIKGTFSKQVTQQLKDLGYKM